VPKLKGTRDLDYESKRRALLYRISEKTLQEQDTVPSLLRMSDYAGVSVPTLRHYFGDRHDLIDAMLTEAAHITWRSMEPLRRPTLTFHASILEYSRALVDELLAVKAFAFGDVLIKSLGEGLLDARISASAREHVLEPALDVLGERLQHHIARKEMIATDTQAAAIFLCAPLILGFLHQRPLHGATDRPMSLSALADLTAGSFVRTFSADIDSAETHVAAAVFSHERKASL